MKHLCLLLGIFILASCGGGNTQNVRVRSNAPTPTPELTEQQKLERDIVLRDETESKMMRGEYLHDGSSVLSAAGDIESVPALLVVLKANPPGPDGAMVCTAGHALEALQEITGANPGYTYETWSNWWKNYKRKNKIKSRLEK